MDVSPRDAASGILEATCVRVPVSSVGSSLPTSFRTARKRAVVSEANMRSTNNLDACALCESIRASVGHRRERRKQQTKAYASATQPHCAQESLGDAQFRSLPSLTIDQISGHTRQPWPSAALAWSAPRCEDQRY